MSALARRRTAGAAVALLILFALQFVVFAAPPAAAQTTEGETTTAGLFKEISAKVGDYECDDTEWHFVITGLWVAFNAPDSITVTFGGGAVVEVPLDKVTGHTAHYRTTEHLDDTVVSATATIFFLWGGQFNLSHGPCPTEKEASITVVKDVPGDGGQEQFLFSLSTQADFWLSDGGSKSFDFRWTYDGPKTITVSEHDDLLGEGWNFVDVVCVDGSGQPAEVWPGEWPAQVNVTLYDGGDYTCTFTNESEDTTTTTTVPTSTTTTTVPTSTTTTTTVPATVQGIQVTTTSTTIPFDPQVTVAGIQVTPSTTIPAVSAETLPFTGAEVGQIALFGLAALGGGGLLVYGARKRDDGDDTGATSTL